MDKKKIKRTVIGIIFIILILTFLCGMRTVWSGDIQVNIKSLIGGK